MRAPLILILSGWTVAGLVASCIYPISGQPTEDGGAVICVKVEPPPPPDAGAQQGQGPTMVYVPVHAPVGTVTTTPQR